MQSFLTTVARLIAEKDLPALMIGGHAVTALGHPRATFDLDLLIPRSSADDWRREFIALRYRVFAESRNFVQFEASPELPLPPVDLMLVEDDVYAALDRTRATLEPLDTPGVMAMIALKLHAARQPGRTQTGQDWSDVLGLISVHQLTLDDPEFSAMVLRHGGEEAVHRIRSATGRGS